MSRKLGAATSTWHLCTYSIYIGERTHLHAVEEKTGEEEEEEEEKRERKGDKAWGDSMLSFRVLDTSIEMREFFFSSSFYLFLRGQRERKRKRDC